MGGGWVQCRWGHGARRSGAKCRECNTIYSRERRARERERRAANIRVRFTEGDESWRDRAACRGQDTDLWFTYRPQPAALWFCGRCPVAAECLAMALRCEGGGGYRFGVFGGLGPGERARIVMEEEVS